MGEGLSHLVLGSGLSATGAGFKPVIDRTNVLERVRANHNIAHRAQVKQQNTPFVLVLHGGDFWFGTEAVRRDSRYSFLRPGQTQGFRRHAGIYRNGLEFAKGPERL